MSHVATFPLLGLIPFRDHTADVEDFERSVVFGAEITDTDPSSGRFTFGHHTVGDLNCALHFKQAGGSREIPGWAFAWPVAIGGSTEEAGLTGSARAGGPYAGPGGAVPPGIRATPPRTGSAPVTGERSRTPFVPPDIDFSPILGGDGYPTDDGFASRHIGGEDLPDGWPGFPKGFVGVSMAGTKAKRELPVFLPTDPRLVAVNFAGDSRMSSVVVDLDDENGVDPTRVAPLHSMLRVVKEPDGRIGFGPRNPLALNFLGGGQDDTAGYGLFFDKVDLLEKRSGAATPSEPNASKPKPVTTDLDAPYVDNRGNPSAYASAGSVATGAGATEATGAAGATLISSEAKAAADKRMAALARMRGVGTISHKASGPIHVGSERDKHKIGDTADGEVINAGHIHTEAYFYLNGDADSEDYDAPLEFQARKYPNPGPLPFISRTHLVMDHAKQHPFVGGAARGLWRWYSEFNMGGTPVRPPPPTTPPPPFPPPTTPGDPPTSPPPSTPTTPSEPNMPATPPGIAPGYPNLPTSPPPGVPSGPGSTPRIPPNERGGPFGGTTGPTSVVAESVRAWEPADGSRSVLHSVGEEAHPVLLFRPQSLSPVAADLRRGSGTPEQVSAEAWRPMVGRLEAFGGMVSGEWELTYGADRGPYGGSGPGGVLFMPPEVSMSDADDLFTPGGVERSTVYFGFAPGAYLGFGLPDLLTGGMKTGYRLGHDGAGLAKVEHLSSAGVASEVLGFDASKQLRIREGGGTILVFSGTLADGQYLRRSGTTLVGGTPAAAIADGDYGDVTVGGSGTTMTIDNDAVTNAKAANMANGTIKGRTTAGTGDPEDLTGAQATALLSAVVGDSGSGGTKGLVPAPGSGDAAAKKVLGADGTFQTVPGRFRAIYVYSSGSGATHAPAAGTTLCRIRAQAGGGGGGGADQGASASGVGAGGGAGGFVEKWWTVNGNITYTVGGGGAGGSAGNNAGSDGGDTTLAATGLSVTAKGGKGGGSFAATAAATVAYAASGGQNAGTTGGDVNVEGSPGKNGMKFGGLTSLMAGDGADSKFGAGGIAPVSSADGNDGAGYGAGGSGGFATAGGSDRAGGDGSPGLLIIEEYW